MDLIFFLFIMFFSYLVFTCRNTIIFCFINLYLDLSIFLENTFTKNNNELNIKNIRFKENKYKIFTFNTNKYLIEFNLLKDDSGIDNLTNKKYIEEITEEKYLSVIVKIDSKEIDLTDEMNKIILNKLILDKNCLELINFVYNKNILIDDSELNWSFITLKGEILSNVKSIERQGKYVFFK